MKISLSLGGGGVRGFAHIGVLKVLLGEGHEIAAIAGSSIGALIGAAYAAGKSPEGIEEYTREIDQGELFRSRPGQQSGFRGVEGVHSFVSEIFKEKTFEDLLIPFAANAVDISSGELIILMSGSLVDALMATISLPGVFEPREWEGKTVFDGGLINPNPVQIARSLAPGLPVVAVILSRPLAPWPRASPLERLIRIPFLSKSFRQTRYFRSMDQFIRAFEIVNHRQNRLQLEIDRPEFEIRPKTEHIETLARVDIQEVIRLGETAARDVLPHLEAFSERRE
ncbi:MAG TPA: patatin-like phospholipase family protein [Anaerolineales bacterium]|nr:patatin-like phospholipase family protein [Anaerolineales bacterium]